MNSNKVQSDRPNIPFISRFGKILYYTKIELQLIIHRDGGCMARTTQRDQLHILAAG